MDILHFDGFNMDIQYTLMYHKVTILIPASLVL